MLITGTYLNAFCSEVLKTHYDAYQITMLKTQLQGVLTKENLFFQLYNLRVASA